MSLTWLKTQRYKLILALLMTLFAMYYFSRINREFIESTGDTFTYQIFADTVFTNHPFKVNSKFDFYDELPIYHHERTSPPLYPIFLAVTHLIFGNSLYVNFYTTTIIGILCALPAFLLGKLLWSERVGLLAAFTSLLFPTLRATAALGMSEPLFTFLTLWAFYCLIEFSLKGERISLLLAGLLTGLAYLTKSTGLVLVSAGLLFLLSENSLNFSKPGFKNKLINTCLFLITVIAVSSPWLIRNYLAFKDPFYNAGRFLIGRGPEAFYSAFKKYSLADMSFFDFVKRFGITAWQGIGLIYVETGILSLLLIYGLVCRYYSKASQRLLGYYVFLSLIISALNPSLRSHHLVHVYPVISLLGIITVASFYQFRRYHSMKDYLKDSLWRQVFLALFFIGLLHLGYNSYFNSRYPVDRNSLIYPEIGEWFKKNTDANAVIMAEPTSPLHYYSQRPLIKFPRAASFQEISSILKKYNIDYIVVFNQETLDVLPKTLSVVKTFITPEEDQRPLILILQNLKFN